MNRLPITSINGMSAVLFGCLFAAQASLVVISPILTRIAADFDVSAGAAGQLRTVSGGVAGVVAVAIVVGGYRCGLREILAGGLGLLAFATLESASAPTFATLAAAQVAVGGGVALVLAGGLAAAATWTSAGQRSSGIARLRWMDWRIDLCRGTVRRCPWGFG